MSKDTEKAARQNYASAHSYLITNKFTLEGYNPGDTREVSLKDAQAMSARNKSKMVGNGRVDGMRTPSVR